MKNNILKQLASVAAVLGVAVSVQAISIPITGSIGWTGLADLNTATAASAVSVLAWAGPDGTGNPVANGSPAVITLMGGNGTTTPFFAPWNFTVSSDIPGFWAVNGVSFELQSYGYVRGTVSGDAYVAIGGYGMITAPGYTPTLYSFTVTFQDPPSGSGVDAFTFSASQAPVPDGGTTAILLGAALSGLSLIRRKLA